MIFVIFAPEFLLSLFHEVNDFFSMDLGDFPRNVNKHIRFQSQNIFFCLLFDRFAYLEDFRSEKIQTAEFKEAFDEFDKVNRFSSAS